MAIRIARSASIADADIEISVRTKRDVASVVVRERLLYLHDFPLGRRVDGLSVRRCTVSSDYRTAWRRRGVIDIEIPILLVLGVEGESEQSLLTAAVAHPVPNVQEGVGRRRIGGVVECDYPPWLQDQIQPVGDALWMSHVHRAVE